ncbi:hypothetical protein DFJ73DRAFT_765202 [Zopfochytrium polystomum]|nr:hypothetical protein DFJ73DRAFT_765202 [Zopfochytrium polystomum]
MTVQVQTIASAIDAFAVLSSPAAQASGASLTAVALEAEAEDAPATLTAATTSDALNETEQLSSDSSDVGTMSAETATAATVADRLLLSVATEVKDREIRGKKAKFVTAGATPKQKGAVLAKKKKAVQKNMNIARKQLRGDGYNKSNLFDIDPERIKGTEEKLKELGLKRSST